MNSIRELGPGDAAIFRDDEQLPWNVERLDDTLLIQSPALSCAAEDQAAMLRGALYANVSGQLPATSRFMADAEAGLRLQHAAPFSQADAALTRAERQYADCRAALRAPAWTDETHAGNEATAPRDIAPEHAHLFDALERTIAADEDLSVTYERRPEDAMAVFESFDAEWLIAVRPGADPDTLALVMALTTAPEDEPDASATMLRALQLNDAGMLGTEVTLGCDIDGASLLLQTGISPLTASVEDVQAAIGRLIAGSKPIRTALVTSGNSLAAATPSPAQTSECLHAFMSAWRA